MTDAPPPSYQSAPAPAVNPGQTLGIVALILAILPFTQVIGLILGFVALNQSKRVGMKNGLAVAAIWISIIFMVLTILFWGFVAIAGAAFTSVVPYSF